MAANLHLGGWKPRWRFGRGEVNTMITMTLTIHSIIAMPEKWAKACQISGQSRLSHAAIVLEALAEYRAWLMASWIFQMLITAAVLISLINRAH
jgi:hypothetical protein